MLQRPFGNLLSSWQEMDRMRREMNRFFSDYTPAAPSFPAMNVWLSEDGAIVTAELPGIKSDDIEITVVNDTLTVKGCRNPQQLEKGVTYHRRERGCGRFNRSFQLPFQVEAGKVEAAFDKGVLQITLPRAEADKPKKIVVKSA